MYEPHANVNLIDEMELMTRGRLVKARLPDQPPPHGRAFAELAEEAAPKGGVAEVVGHTSPATVCAFSLSGSVLATGDSKGLVVTWEAPKEELNK